jgi:hypothetical protein
VYVWESNHGGKSNVEVVAASDQMIAQLFGNNIPQDSGLRIRYTMEGKTLNDILDVTKLDAAGNGYAVVKEQGFNTFDMYTDTILDPTAGNVLKVGTSCLSVKYLETSFNENNSK